MPNSLTEPRAGGLPPPVLPRRVIQIAPREAHGSSRPGLWALCNDGTMWLHVSSPLNDEQWERVPEIPQGAPQ